MKRSMTTEELFNKIRDILKENNKLQDILDYGLAAHHPVPVTTYDFDLKSNLAYGGNEGICLSLWIEHYEDGEKRLDDIGNFKTLRGDREAMHIMAGLLADFIIEEYAYVNARLDDFKWGVRHPVDASFAWTGVERRGADVHAFDGYGRRLKWRYSCVPWKRP